MTKFNKILTIALLNAFFFFVISCKKLVVVSSPVNALTSENVYSDNATAASVLTGVYMSLNTNTPQTFSSINSISLASGLSADELIVYGGAANANSTLVQFYLNQLTPGLSTSSGQTIWKSIYSSIYVINVALERLLASNSLTPIVKQQLTGEAKFLRAFFYFYLVNLYGDVPLTTTSDYRFNSMLTRAPKTVVYQQVIADLKESQGLLSNGYVASDAMSNTLERVRPNKWAATALLARAYLYSGAYDSAEIQATAVINNTALYDTISLENVFLKNSREAIWQLQPVNAGWNTEDARVFILPSTGPTGNTSGSGFPVYLSPHLLNSFEPGDQRRRDWVDSVIVNSRIYYYPFKYKSATFNNPVTEYLMVLRIGEQYLIRAEARADVNNFNGALSDLNTIRARAGLQGVTAGDKASLLAAIMHERQVELFTEWGHRWLDLKRTDNLEIIMDNISTSKGSTWNSNWQWYPIPAYDIVQDPNLTQNPGY